MALNAEVLTSYKQIDEAYIDELLKKEIEKNNKKIVVLDDDPTGVQTVHDISVYTNWEKDTIRQGFDEENNLFYILTNSRGFTAEQTTKAHNEIAAVVDEGDVVAALFRFHLEAVQHGGEVFVGQAALPFVHEQNAQVVSSVGLQGAGGGVGQVAHAVRCGAYPLPCGRRDIRLVVQCLADRCHRHAAFLCQIFQGWHRLLASFPKNGFAGGCSSSCP